MKKACLVVGPPYDNDEIFNPENHSLNRDGCLEFFHELKRHFKFLNYDLRTSDLIPVVDADLVIYNEMPKILPRPEDKQKSVLLIFESELIRPDNWLLSNHERFQKIFTWNDLFIDGSKYFKFNFTHSASLVDESANSAVRFCTLIAGNKYSTHPLELYSQRRKAIRWFERYLPSDFEFYGVGWEQYTFHGARILRPLNRIRFLRELFSEKWPSYRGTVESKLSTLSRYKFSICYENARDIPGYITEKIFDSIQAGCLPIYWGAPNISDFVPESCYIDRRKYADLGTLITYLKNMTDEEYRLRKRSMEDYLISPLHQLFTPKNVAISVVEVITKY